jgi:hypothetical protein
MFRSWSKMGLGGVIRYLLAFPADYAELLRQDFEKLKLHKHPQPVDRADKPRYYTEPLHSTLKIVAASVVTLQGYFKLPPAHAKPTYVDLVRPKHGTESHAVLPIYNAGGRHCGFMFGEKVEKLQ